MNATLELARQVNETLPVPLSSQVCLWLDSGNMVIIASPRAIDSGTNPHAHTHTLHAPADGRVLNCWRLRARNWLRHHIAAGHAQGERLVGS